MIELREHRARSLFFLGGLLLADAVSAGPDRPLAARVGIPLVTFLIGYATFVGVAVPTRAEVIRSTLTWAMIAAVLGLFGDRYSGSLFGASFFVSLFVAFVGGATILRGGRASSRA